MVMKRWFQLITAFFIIGALLSCDSGGKNNKSLLLLLLGSGFSSGGGGNLDVATHFAGSDGGGSYRDGAGAAARFNGPYGITNDGSNLYVADSKNNTIRKIVISSGAVATLAGTAGSSGSTDGTGTAARFFHPDGVTNDGANLYVADTYNSTIRKIVISTGGVTTFAGTAGSYGSMDGIGTAAEFYWFDGITCDGSNLYVADTYNHTIRKIVISSAVVTTLAGCAASSGSTDGAGTAARFYHPRGITSDGSNLYVADSENDTIRKIIISTGAVTTLAGTAGLSGSTDGAGAAARFRLPFGITCDGANLYVADASNYTIRKIVISTGAVTTLAGSAGLSGSTDATGAAARFNFPSGITNDGSNLYVADTDNHTIRKIVISSGAVTTLAGSAGSSGSTDATGAAARFNGPYGITSDGSNLYVADTSNHTIRKIVISSGVVTTLAGTALSSGSTDGTGTAARFDGPSSIIYDSVNNKLFVADTGNNCIRKLE